MAHTSVSASQGTTATASVALVRSYLIDQFYLLRISKLVPKSISVITNYGGVTCTDWFLLFIIPFYKKKNSYSILYGTLWNMDVIVKLTRTMS